MKIKRARATQLRPIALLLASSALILAGQGALAGDWLNAGGNAGRNGLSDERGPNGADLLWSGGRGSLIAWQPVIEGNRAFMVRQPGWPGDPSDSTVVAMDLDDGSELWDQEIPYQTGDWITWVAGVMNGQVYASRAGNGASVDDHLYALDAVNGDILWMSDDLIDAGPYDGVVFAPDGDPVIASFQDIWRIDSDDGSTVWHSARTGSVSGTCGGAIHGDALYVADAAPGGHVIVRYDLTTGAWMYESPVMAGFTLQNTPLVGPGGTIHLSRTQNNPAVDYFYTLEDDGGGFIEKWSVPAAWSTTSEFAVGPDGSIYMLAPGPVIARLDPADGSLLDSQPLPGSTGPRVAVDGFGQVFVANGEFATGRLYAFESDLTPLWDTPVTNINIGGPALGALGTLVICGVGTDVRAYRTDYGTPTPAPTPPPTTTPAPTEVPSATPSEIPTGTPSAGPTATPTSPPPIPSTGSVGLVLLLGLLTLLIPRRRLR